MIVLDGVVELDDDEDGVEKGVVRLEHVVGVEEVVELEVVELAVVDSPNTILLVYVGSHWNHVKPETGASPYT